MLTVEEIFTRVLELPPTQQDEFLRSVCQDDHALQAEVISLLKALPDAEVFFRNAWQEFWDEGCDAVD